MSFKNNFLSSFSAGISTAHRRIYIGYRGGGGQLGGQFIFHVLGPGYYQEKTRRAFIGKGFLARFLISCSAAEKTFPFTFELRRHKPRAHDGMMKSKNVATLDELIGAARQLHVKFIACENGDAHTWIKKEDLIDDVKEVIGVPTFLKYSEDAPSTFYLSETMKSIGRDQDHCPMTFVKVKIALERTCLGKRLDVLLLQANL